MPKREIVLTICDKHIQDGDTESSELMTTGFFEGDAHNCTISYAEQDEALKSCITTLHVEGQERITMVRTGTSTAEIILEKHKRHNCHYNTPYGSFVLGVYAKEIAAQISAEQACGVLAFRYTLDFNSANSTENELNIFFKEATDNVPHC